MNNKQKCPSHPERDFILLVSRPIVRKMSVSYSLSLADIDRNPSRHNPLNLLKYVVLTAILFSRVSDESISKLSV